MRTLLGLLLLVLVVSLSGCSATNSDDATMQGYGGSNNNADPSRY